MVAVIQRVSSSSVSVNGKLVGEIGPGLNVLLGIKKGDNDNDIAKVVGKIVNLRIFQDDAGKMNRSLLDTGGDALVISQFTLTGSIKKGRRPSFDESADPKTAKALYELFVKQLQEHLNRVETGEFGAMMDVRIHNDGPVTFIIDSKELN